MSDTVVALLLGLVVLSGCSDDPGPTPDPKPEAKPTVSVEDAPQAYGSLVTSVVDAVGEVSVPGRSDGEPASVYYDGELESCVFASERYEFDTVFGEETSWDDVRAATEQALEPAGFELTDQLDIPGGFNGFDAETDDGSVVEVRSKLGNPSTISLDAPVTGSCDRS